MRTAHWIKLLLSSVRRSYPNDNKDDAISYSEEGQRRSRCRKFWNKNFGQRIIIIVREVRRWESLFPYFEVNFSGESLGLGCELLAKVSLFLSPTKYPIHPKRHNGEVPLEEGWKYTFSVLFSILPQFTLLWLLSL